MARMWNDPQVEPIRVLSRSEINAQVIAGILKAQGIDARDIHCSCCGVKLANLATVKISTEGPVGPECSEPGHIMPCRRHATPLVWPYEEK